MPVYKWGRMSRRKWHKAWLYVDGVHVTPLASSNGHRARPQCVRMFEDLGGDAAHAFPPKLSVNGGLESPTACCRGSRLGMETDEGGQLIFHNGAFQTISRGTFPAFYLLLLIRH